MDISKRSVCCTLLIVPSVVLWTLCSQIHFMQGNVLDLVGSTTSAVVVDSALNDKFDEEEELEGNSPQYSVVNGSGAMNTTLTIEKETYERLRRKRKSRHDFIDPRCYTQEKHQSRIESRPSGNESMMGVIDGMLNGHYPTLRVSTIPSGKSNFRSFRRVHWKLDNQGKVQRCHGIGLMSAGPELGGKTVQGKWPDKIRQLTYISILKNGLTTMGIAFDEMSQRLGGLNETPFVSLQEIPAYIEQELIPNWNQSLLFTILRDPVDRFVSATCQDHKLRHRPSPCTRKSTLNETWDCILEELERGLGTPHQNPQHAQLYNSVGGYSDLEVTILPFGIQDRLTEEMGVTKTEHHRQRKNDLNDNERVSDICLTEVKDFSAEYLKRICNVYHEDVSMLRSVGQPVKSCEVM